MRIEFISSIGDIDADSWNRLVGCATDTGNPFIQHDFLLALEKHDCLHDWGWHPQHCLLYDDSRDDSRDNDDDASDSAGKDRLIGAAPAYIKDNSYGEFVFDWAWADAYQRHGMPYYPKLVTAIPFTPAKGPRLLAADEHTTADGETVSQSTIKKGLISALTAYADKNELSSSHFLFCEDDDIACFPQDEFLFRFDYQFHWSNNAYHSFDDFLGELNSKRRKNIRRERRKVAEEDIDIKVVDGVDLSEQQWQAVYDFYRITFMRKSGAPTLTLDFFMAVAHKLKAILAYHRQGMVAAAICFQGEDKFYGRHWGCSDDYDSLHFEVCYYTGIEHCIANGLQVFEPGAQGEHKIWRGFMPTRTNSAHWIAHPGFRQALAEHLQHEALAMEQHGKLLQESSPFR